MATQDDEPVYILNCVDINYLSHCSVLWLAVLDHLGTKSKYRAVHFFVSLEGGTTTSVSLCNYLECFVRGYQLTHPHVLVTASIVPASNLHRVHAHAASADWPDAVFGRFFIASILPKSAKRALYLDVDLVVRGDVGQLIDYDMQNATIAACRNDCSRSDYFNSGVILVNLTKWRQENCEQALVKIQHECAHQLKYPDQDVLNLLFSEETGNFMMLPSKWNTLISLVLPFSHRIHCLSSCCYATQASINDAEIFHAVARPKPWAKPHSTEFSFGGKYHSYARMAQRVREYAMKFVTDECIPEVLAGPKFIDDPLKWLLASQKQIIRKFVMHPAVWQLYIKSVDSEVFRHHARPPWSVAGSDEAFVAGVLIQRVHDLIDAGVIDDGVEICRSFQAMAQHLVVKEKVFVRGDGGDSGGQIAADRPGELISLKIPAEMMFLSLSQDACMALPVSDWFVQKSQLSQQSPRSEFILLQNLQSSKTVTVHVSMIRPCYMEKQLANRVVQSHQSTSKVVVLVVQRSIEIVESPAV